MKRILTFAMMLLFTAAVFAQNNDKISYQAVVRNSSNVLVYDEALTVDIAIANSATGTAVYSEKHNVTSNANGLVSLMIGDGSNVSGNWADIEWNHAWVTATIKKQTNGEQLAQHHVPMSAVPYALYAEDVNCDAVNACVGDGKLTIKDATNTYNKEYTANQTGDQTVTLGKTAFTNNYNDLTNKPTIPSAPNNGVLTIKDASNTYSNTFTADQAGNTNVTLGKTAFTNSYNDLSDKPTIPSSANNGVLTFTDGTNTINTFSANQADNTSVTLGNGKLTITDGNTNTKEFTANQTGNQTVTLGTAAFTNNYSDLNGTPTIPTPGNGTLTITDGDDNSATFTANQATGTNTTITLGTAAFTNSYEDLDDKPDAPNDATITIKDADGYTIGDFTVNQATDKDIYLPDYTFPKQKSARFTATAAQTTFVIPNSIVPSPWTINDEDYVVQMYINGVYVGDQNDNVISVTGKTITYAPANNGSYTIVAGDRVQFVFWLSKMLYY